MYLEASAANALMTLIDTFGQAKKDGEQLLWQSRPPS